LTVGGGSAGSVVANRLSKNKMNSVLLLEAGGVTNFLLEYPAMCYVGQLQVPAVDWMFETLSQPNTSLGLNDHVGGIILKNISSRIKLCSIFI